jgi:hypothetical protein
MRYPEQLSVRVPEGTKARLRAQAAPGETLVSVLLRAITALETAPAAKTSSLSLEQRLASIEKRLGDLEQQASLSPSSEAGAVVGDEPDRRPAGARRYPEHVKRQAVQMRTEGYSRVQIADWIESQTGRRPNISGLPSQLTSWARALGIEEP